jgi:hypothetical protein
MLVPVRETVSVPMPKQEDAVQDNSKLYVLAGVGALLALAIGGFVTAAFLHLRKRKDTENENEG